MIGSAKKHLTVTPSSMVIPRHAGMARKPPRPPGQQQKSYKEKFDFRTLFYDVFHSGSDIVLSGPPLLNLKPEMERADFSTELGAPLTPTFTDLDRTQRSLIHDAPSAQLLTMTTPLVTLSTEVSRDLGHLFANRKVLFTKSKNNRLDWIHDWALFHVETHGVDAVLLYDNGSTEYVPEDVVEALARIPGLDVIVVVRWPFPFGPQGGNWDRLTNAPWDSDFCEYGIMEHARYRFLTGAAAVINADIDELVLLGAGGSVFDLLMKTGSPGMTYHGRWIETVGAPTDALLSFADFQYFDDRRVPTTRKWVARPSLTRDAAQWKTHQISGVDLTPSTQIQHRHFMGINSDWKRARTHQVPLDPTVHHLDRDLTAALGRVFGPSHRDDRALVWGLDDPSAPQPSELLLEIQARLSESRFDNLKRVHLWFYRPNCLVVDFRVDGLPMAVDLIDESGRIAVKLIGRTEQAKVRVRELMGKTGLVELGGKYHLPAVAIPTGHRSFGDGVEKLLRAIGTRALESRDGGVAS